MSAIRRIRLCELALEHAEKKFVVRARVQAIRAKGKGCFLILSEGIETVQGVIFEGEQITLDQVKTIGKITPESIVDVTGIIKPAKVNSTTKTDLEMAMEKVDVISMSNAVLPFQFADACHPAPEDEEPTTPATPATPADAPAAAGDKKKEKGRAKKAEEAPKDRCAVHLQTRLDSRWMDMRTPASNATFRIQSAVGSYFREYLLKSDFVEIHTPKMIGAASEGGANVFKLKYFERDAFLAQSPQLYKQMALMGDLFRVFEIGPVFRAENSNTPRHLTEFTGMDIEMVIYDSYEEVLDVAEGLFHHIFNSLYERNKNLIEIIRNQVHFNDLVWQVPEDVVKELDLSIIESGHVGKDGGRIKNLEMRSLRLPYSVGVQMINEEGRKQADWKDMNDDEDLTTINEKLLGRLVKDKYKVDFYILDKYPLAVRPFYTYPEGGNPESKWSESYDFFIRGEEITSGARRIHDIELLKQRVAQCGVAAEKIADYINCFSLGAYPHGGFGVGLERVVMLTFGLGNIRKASMFPRDPKRLTP